MISTSDKAYAEYQRVRPLVKFNVRGHDSRKRLNQYATRYTFDDDSALVLFKSGKAQAYNAQGLCVVVGSLLPGAHWQQN